MGVTGGCPALIEGSALSVFQFGRGFCDNRLKIQERPPPKVANVARAVPKFRLGRHVFAEGLHSSVSELFAALPWIPRCRSFAQRTDSPNNKSSVWGRNLAPSPYFSKTWAGNIGFTHCCKYNRQSLRSVRDANECFHGAGWSRKRAVSAALRLQWAQQTAVSIGWNTTDWATANPETAAW